MITVMDTTDKSHKHKKKKKTELSSRGMIVRVLLVALLTFGVYELGRYANLWDEPNELRAIKSESLASTELLGLKLVKAEQMGEGSVVGKSVSPNITRIFKAKKDDAEATKRQIIKYAESEGWAYDPSISNDDSWWGRKTVGRFDLGISIKKSLRYDDSVEVGIF